MFTMYSSPCYIKASFDSAKRYLRWSFVNVDENNGKGEEKLRARKIKRRQFIV